MSSASADNTLLDLHNSSFHAKDMTLFYYPFKIFPELLKHKMHLTGFSLCRRIFATGSGQFLRCCWILDISLL